MVACLRQIDAVELARLNNSPAEAYCLFWGGSVSDVEWVSALYINLHAGDKRFTEPAQAWLRLGMLHESPERRTR